MMAKARSGWPAVAALALALALFAPFGPLGCGGGKVDSNSYTVRQAGSGEIIGSQRVNIEETGEGVVYTATEKLPYAEFDTDCDRTYKVAADLKNMISYKSAMMVPGATYTITISSVEEGFSFLKDDLTVFNYVPLLPQGKRVMPLEPDSACMAQAFLDRFLAAGVSAASAFVVVPSEGPAVHEVLIERRTQFHLHVSGQGFEDVDIDFDANSFVTGVRAARVLIQKGSGGAGDSRAFAPASAAVRVDTVRVPTTERLKDGDRLELAGRMYFPSSGRKPYKAAILTGEAGPQDWTGGGFLSQVADSLAGRGFAVLSCDRRGIPESAGDFATHTRSTLLSDLNSQVDYLVNRGDVNTEEITLVGYGEGGLISAAAAAANPYVRSLVLMATPSVRMFPDMASVDLREAARRGDILAEEAAYGQRVIDDLVGLVSSSTGDTVEIGGRKVFLGWMRSWMQADPPRDLSGLKVPVLVMQPAADEVVPPSQATAIMSVLAGRAGGVQKLETYDGLGHGFGKELSQAESIPYRQHPVIERKVLEALGEWLEGH